MIFYENLTSIISRARFMEPITETKPLTKHIQTAVNAIQKEIDKRESQVLKLLDKSQKFEDQAEALKESIVGLESQISKLKGD